MFKLRLVALSRNLLNRSFFKEMATKTRLLSEDYLMSKCKTLAPALTADKHKGQAGRIGVFGGSLEYTGAPFYSAISALKTGADLVYVFCMKDAATVIKSYSPELIVLPYLDEKNADTRIEPWLERLHVVLIGPGLGRDEATFEVIRKIIRNCAKLKKPLIIDADGLFLIAHDKELIRDYPAKLILTPNIAEFSRLVDGNEEKYRENSAKLFELCGNLTILRKGREDLIFDKDCETKITGSGSGRRSGGQGDILAGAIATFLTWSLEKSVEKYDERVIHAIFAACKLVRECNKTAFVRCGRSMTALDMTHDIHAVFERFFETKKNIVSNIFD